MTTKEKKDDDDDKKPDARTIDGDGTQKKKKKKMKKKRKKKKKPTCKVIAPETMAGGTEFETENIDGIKFIVTVPDGGVTKGSTFTVPCPSSKSKSKSKKNQNDNNINNLAMIPSTITSTDIQIPSTTEELMEELMEELPVETAPTTTTTTTTAVESETVKETVTDRKFMMGAGTGFVVGAVTGGFLAHKYDKKKHEKEEKKRKAVEKIERKRQDKLRKAEEEKKRIADEKERQERDRLQRETIEEVRHALAQSQEAAAIAQAQVQAQQARSQAQATPIAQAYPVQQQQTQECIPVADIATTVQVMAPSTMNGGHMFEAEVDGIKFMVTVPENGINQGELFTVPYPTATAATTTTYHSSVMNSTGPRANNNNNTNAVNAYDIPTTNGTWRTELFDCFPAGSCCLCCMGFCCTPIVMAQLMQRMKFNLCGVPVRPNGTGYKCVCIVLSIATICICIFGYVFSVYEFMIAYYMSFSVWVVYLTIISTWFVYLTIISTCTRYSMRQKYNIRSTFCNNCGDENSCCGGMEDCCAVFWCSWCSTIQMISHTHDARKYPYHLKSQTGLNEYAPDINIV
jgi:gas vesicle protein